MKKAAFILIAPLLATTLFAQSEKFVKAMEPKVNAVDTTHSTEALVDLANSFERIADAEKTQWTAYYYAALAHINAGLMIASANGLNGGISDKTDPEADKAETLLSKAEALSKDNSEIWVLKKQIATLRMMGDPMSRYMVYGPAAAEALATAKKLNPDNPRVYLLEGQDLYFTPEQFGGDKQEAKKRFEEALNKYETYKPETSIDPSWGSGQAKYFLSQIK